MYKGRGVGGVTLEGPGVGGGLSAVSGDRPVGMGLAMGTEGRRLGRGSTRPDSRSSRSGQTGEMG